MIGLSDPLSACMRAAILRACAGSTRVSESPVTNIMGGYFVPLWTFWYGEYFRRYGNCLGSSAEPYSAVHQEPTDMCWKRSISNNGAPHTMAPNRSGRCVIMAPISRPPFDPPWIASFDELVYLFWISHSAAAMKSS